MKLSYRATCPYCGAITSHYAKHLEQEVFSVVVDCYTGCRKEYVADVVIDARVTTRKIKPEGGEVSAERLKAPGVVPVSDVRSIGEKRNCLGVILYAIELSGETFTVTTWGKNRQLCKHMADIGKKLADCIFDGTVEPAATEPPDCQHCNGTGIEAVHD